MIIVWLAFLPFCWTVAAIAVGIRFLAYSPEERRNPSFIQTNYRIVGILSALGGFWVLLVPAIIAAVLYGLGKTMALSGAITFKQWISIRPWALALPFVLFAALFIYGTIVPTGDRIERNFSQGNAAIMLGVLLLSGGPLVFAFFRVSKLMK
jgi:hypothetical protein